MTEIETVSVKALADLLFALETASQDQIDEDFSIKVSEMTAASLLSLSEENQRTISSFLSQDIGNGDLQRATFFKSFSENYGLAASSSMRGT
ncbi:MAG: hypothetical protein AAGF53_11960 [Pseudomonadota bacterium]